MQSGFTLIEVVVAFVILSLALAVIYESFGWSLRRSATVRQREHAWLTAQSLLSELRRQPQLPTGSREGVTNEGLRWTSNVRTSDPQVAEQAGKQASNQKLAAFEVTLQVRWGERAAQQIRLQSIEVPGMLP